MVSIGSYCQRSTMTLAPLTGLIALALAGVAWAQPCPSGGLSLEQAMISENIYSLILDTVAGDPGANVSFDVTLHNEQPVSSFNLLISYDPTVLEGEDVTIAGTRADEFEYFGYAFDPGGSPGEVRIEGIADIPGGPTVAPLPTGSGSICSITFAISSSLAYSGLTAPVRFAFQDGPDGDDNTLTDAQGDKISQAAISYHDGYVYVNILGEINIGDINLNGIAREIGDAIYFTNYFMDPIGYPLDPLQMANSDVNGDNIAASIADLVALINSIIHGSGAFRVIPGKIPVAKLLVASANNATTLSYESEHPVGGIFLVVRLDDGASLDDHETLNLSKDMTLEAYRDGNELRLLIYSLEGNWMPAGIHAFAVVNAAPVRFKTAELSTQDGRLASLSYASGQGVVPHAFELQRNYPNPFNPETTIGFSLSQDSYVRLVVFNVLGQEINVLVNDKLNKGDHLAIWDGRNKYGFPVASGVYLYRLEADSLAETRKMVLIR